MVITTWEATGSAPRRFPRDLPGLLVQAGLEVDTVLDRPGWLARQLAIYRAAAALADDGDPAIADLAEEGRRWGDWHGQTRRVVAAASRPGDRQRAAAPTVARFPPAPPLMSGRVRLGPLRVEHAEEMAPLLDDPGLHRFIGGRPATLAELRSRCGRQSGGFSADGSQRWLNWIVRRCDDGRALGAVQATVSADADGLRAEVAWVVAAVHQRQGFAVEATSVMVAWLRRRGVGRIVAHIHPDHLASNGVARRIGLSPTPGTVDGELRWEEQAGPPDGP